MSSPHTKWKTVKAFQNPWYTVLKEDIALKKAKEERKNYYPQERYDLFQAFLHITDDQGNFLAVPELAAGGMPYCCVRPNGGKGTHIQDRFFCRGNSTLTKVVKHLVESGVVEHTMHTAINEKYPWKVKNSNAWKLTGKYRYNLDEKIEKITQSFRSNSLTATNDSSPERVVLIWEHNIKMQEIRKSVLNEEIKQRQYELKTIEESTRTLKKSMRPLITHLYKDVKSKKEEIKKPRTKKQKKKT